MFNELFSGSPKFTYNSDTNEFKSIKEFLEDHDKAGTYEVKGMYVTKGGNYGPSGVVVLDGINLNVPKHMNEKINQIRANAEMVEAINSGKCGLKFRDYDKDGKTFVTVDFVDM